MFGGRLIPSLLIGFGVGWVLYLISSMAASIVAGIPPEASSIGFAIGLAIPVGIGLHKDAKEAME